MVNKFSLSSSPPPSPNSVTSQSPWKTGMKQTKPLTQAQIDSIMEYLKRKATTFLKIQCDKNELNKEETKEAINNLEKELKADLPLYNNRKYLNEQAHTIARSSIKGIIQAKKQKKVCKTNEAYRKHH